MADSQISPEMFRAGLTIWWALYALHNAGAPMKSSTPKRKRGGRGVPLPSQLEVMENVV